MAYDIEAIKSKIVSELGLNPFEDVILVGSGAMAANNIRPAEDIDLVVTYSIFNRLSKLKFFKNSFFKDGAPRLTGQDFDIIIKWDKPDCVSCNFEELHKDSSIIKGVRTLSLERVLSWKHRNSRAKDKRDILLIEEFMSS
jgi:hypothetical protein